MCFSFTILRNITRDCEKPVENPDVGLIEDVESEDEEDDCMQSDNEDIVNSCKKCIIRLNKITRLRKKIYRLKEKTENLKETLSDWQSQEVSIPSVLFLCLQ